MPNGRNGADGFAGNLLPVLAVLALFLFIVGQIFDLWWFAFADWARLQGPDLSGIKSRKDVFEASYYLAQIALLGVAVIAGLFAYGQFREAEKSRLASIYISMDDKWASPALFESRKLMHAIVSACVADPVYRDRMRDFPSPAAREAMQEFAHSYLSRKKSENYEEYLKTMAIVDFVETLGMMVRRSYLNADDIEPLIGMITVAIHDIIAKHLAIDIERNRRIYRLQGFARAPDDYDNFVFLAAHFRRRFA